jgi:hypothetical protein
MLTQNPITSVRHSLGLRRELGALLRPRARNAVDLAIAEIGSYDRERCGRCSECVACGHSPEGLFAELAHLDASGISVWVDEHGEPFGPPCEAAKNAGAAEDELEEMWPDPDSMDEDGGIPDREYERMRRAELSYLSRRGVLSMRCALARRPALRARSRDRRARVVRAAASKTSTGDPEPSSRRTSQAGGAS